MTAPTTAPADLGTLDDAGFATRILGGDVRAGARLMRFIDDRHPRAVAILKRLHPHAGRAHIVGLTGNPGAGKSTLAAALVAHWRGLGKRVGVVAVDPSSPFSGGAILGDRIRMTEHSLDDRVFIRSVATRGHMGGLSRSANDIAMVMDAMGYDPILIETVGVGQDEIDVVKVAETTAVVLVPGLGDEIQAIKAGLLEIADVFAVNKADRDGALRAEKDLRMLQSLGAHAEGRWEPPIVRTIAIQREGIGELADAIAAHRRQLAAPGSALLDRARTRARHVLESLVTDRVTRELGQMIDDATLDAIAARDRDPWSEAERLFAAIRHDRGPT